MVVFVHISYDGNVMCMLLLVARWRMRKKRKVGRQFKHHPMEVSQKQMRYIKHLKGK